MKIAIRALLLIFIVALIFYFSRFARESEFVRSFAENHGYLGVFVISIISGFNLAVPIPAVAFIPLFLESGLEFWVVIGVISVGVTLADSLAYFAGRVGKEIVAHSFEDKILIKLGNIRERYPHAPMFILFFFASFVPIPNEVLVIPLGFLGYRLVKIIPVVFAGNLVFNGLYAAGLINIFHLL